MNCPEPTNISEACRTVVNPSTVQASARQAAQLQLGSGTVQLSSSDSKRSGKAKEQPSVAHTDPRGFLPLSVNK